MGIFDLFPCCKPRVPGDPVFDAHCHVFNFEYLVLEAGQIIWDLLRGAYPRASDRRLAALSPGLDGSKLVDEAENLLAWILEILIAGFNSEAGNAARLRAAAKRTWRVRKLSLIPLMMDIYYLYAEPLEPGSPYPPTPSLKGAAPQTAAGAESAFQERVKRALEKAIAKLENEDDRKAAAAMSVAGFELSAEGFGRLARRISGQDALKAEAEEGLPRMAWTAGFKEQFRQIRKLGAAASGIYPFFALDLRREGARDFAMDLSQVGPKGPFYGVKLYPRLGCHPANPGFEELFRHCAANRVPITTHASYGGFPDWIDAYAGYGEPGNFADALEGNPGLTIDFAHFGDRTPPGLPSWGAQIAALIAANDGVYSDLSCYTHQASINAFQASYMGLPKVMERTMFGSDFDVMYFTNPGITLDAYFRSFLDSFSGAELGKMASANPKAFLGL